MHGTSAVTNSKRAPSEREGSVSVAEPGQAVNAGAPHRKEPCAGKAGKLGAKDQVREKDKRDTGSLSDAPVADLLCVG